MASKSNDQTQSTTPSAILWFDDVTMDDLPRVGGKNASLGEMTRALNGRGIRVPGGFAITADAFRRHVREAGLEPRIYQPLESLDINDIEALGRTAGKIREAILATPLPPAITAEVRAAYDRLSARYGQEPTDVAVRSSATAEDLPSASFAGQQETFLNVRGYAALDHAIRACMASLFTDRAIVYRARNGFAHRDVALSVGVQKMVRSDLGSAGVIFTLDTESGFRDVILVTAAYGLGESVVQGRVRPDEFWVHKPTLRAGFPALIRRERGDKGTKLVYAAGGTRSVAEVRVSAADRAAFALSDDQVLKLAKWALAIEEHYSTRNGRATPMDIEWGLDGQNGELYILQARPETIHARQERPRIELYQRLGPAEVLLHGKSVGTRVGSGRTRVVHAPSELASFKQGEVLVARMTDPDWEPVLTRAAAVVTDEGGRTCHAAIVSRELGIPCVVGTRNGTEVLTDGTEVTVSCAEGDDGKVYAGRVAFDRREIEPAHLGETRVPLMLITGNPDKAFHLAQLPAAGVGLVRIEFVISSWIGVHPMALIAPGRITDAERREIRARTAGYARPGDFFIDRLRSGVAQIAAAFYPRPVVVRFSDFKTNEYANLLGGKVFEPAEANPMIGFRGASRYYDERYRQGFALECAALRSVRDDLGLTNVKLMVPFCRTLEEGRRVLAEMEKNGLVRGRNGLEVLVMCEIPSNVILAEEFSELFDGFSIGSNDLTQLTLGVDRDSADLAHLFDERDPAVKKMIVAVLRAAHARGRPVGICGQAPSDHLELAVWLADQGIDSISLNPDSLPRVAEQLVRAHPSPPASLVRPGEERPPAVGQVSLGR